MIKDIEKLRKLKGALVEIKATSYLTERLAGELDKLDISIRKPLTNTDEYVALLKELEESTSKTLFIKDFLIRHEKLDYINGRMEFTLEINELIRRIYLAVTTNSHCVISVNSSSGLYLLATLPFWLSLVLEAKESSLTVTINKLHNTDSSNHGIFDQPKEHFRDSRAISTKSDIYISKKSKDNLRINDK